MFMPHVNSLSFPYIGHEAEKASKNSGSTLFPRDRERRLTHRCHRWLRGHVTDDVLRCAGLIEIETTQILTDQPQNHELHAREENDGAENGRDTVSYIRCEPNFID